MAGAIRIKDEADDKTFYNLLIIHVSQKTLFTTFYVMLLSVERDNTALSHIVQLFHIMLATK